MSLDIDVGIDAVIAKSDKAIEICNCYGLVEKKKRIPFNRLNYSIIKYITVDNNIPVNTNKKGFIYYIKAKKDNMNFVFRADTEYNARLLYSVNKIILGLYDL